MKICQGCKQPIAPGERYEASAAPDGSTWYLHRWIGDCVRAMLAAAAARQKEKGKREKARQAA